MARHRAVLSQGGKGKAVSRTDVYWGTRVIVPPQLRSNVVDEIHDGHPGCKSFARGYVLWPGIDGDSKQCVRQCLLCQRNHKAPKGPVKSWEWSEKPYILIILSKELLEVNADPLSETMVCGNPCIEKCSLLIVAVADVDGTTCASIHLLCNVFPSSGPAPPFIQRTG